VECVLKFPGAGGVNLCPLGQDLRSPFGRIPTPQIVLVVVVVLRPRFFRQEQSTGSRPPFTPIHKVCQLRLGTP
jgi:hypothetical protein